MTVKADNPAGRLCLLLNKFYGAPSSVTLASGTRTSHIKERLAHVFDISPDDKEGLLNGLFQLHKLIDDVEQSLSSREGLNPTLYIEPLKRIRKAFFITDMNVQWEYTYHPTFQRDTTSLEFAAELLSQQPEKLVPDEELTQLLNDLNDLYETILASSLGLELKTLILSQLEVIRRAIHDYRIRGFSSLREALERTAGSYFVNESLIDQEKGKEEVKSYKNFLSRFASTVSFASNATRLIEAAAKWLPLLTSGEPPDVPPPQM